jgi:hypothetical protein
MNETKRATLLIGSPRGLASTSESLGTYVLQRLREHGLETGKAYVNPSLNSDKNREALLRLVDISDLLILAFPLYVDSLPSRVVAALELIAEHKRAVNVPKRRRLVAIVNSGFPEARQSDTALAICRRFAKEAELDWAGGLALGGGQLIAGRALAEVGGVVRNVMKALDLTAAAVAEGELVPKEAADLMAKPLLPSRLYIWLANRRWNRQIREYGTRPRLYDRPYLVGPVGPEPT